MSEQELMHLASLLRKEVMPLLQSHRLASENVASCIEVMNDLNDCLEYAFADIAVIEGYEIEEEQNELRREIEFRKNVILG